MANADIGNFMNSYKAVSDIANGDSGSANNTWLQGPTREMNPTEQFMAGLANLGSSLSDVTGFQKYASDNGGILSLGTPEGALRFATSLPFQTMSALPSGVANLYAGISGNNVVYGADAEANRISDEKLDFGQSAASVATGLIDTLGLAAGGSGSMLRETGRAIRAGRAAGTAANAVRNSGIMSKITGSGLLDSGALRAGSAFLGDVAEEAGEEFFQSLAEDAIQKQLDEGSLGRALESAAYGAAGGALMSGGALGMRAFTNDHTHNGASQPNSAYGRNNPYAPGDELIGNAATRGYGHVTNYAASSAEERMLSDFTKKDPGSMNLMLVNSGKYTGFAEIGLRVGDIRAWANSSDEAAAALARFFCNNNDTLDPDGLRGILSNRDADVARMLNGQLLRNYASTGGRAKVGFKRDPASDEGFIWAYVAGVDVGQSGLDMSGTLAKAVGGDYDSDHGSVFVDPEVLSVTPGVWAYDMLLRNEDDSGAKPTTKFEWTYSSLKYYRTNPEAFKKQREKYENSLKRWQTVRGLDGNADFDRVREQCQEILWEAYSHDPEEKDREISRDVDISIALTKIRSIVGEFFQKNPGVAHIQKQGVPGRPTITDADYFSNNFIDAMFHSLHHRPQSEIIDENAEYFNEENKRRVKNDKDKNAGEALIGTPGRRSNLGTATTGPEEAGLSDYYNAASLEQYYRDYATVIYPNAKVHLSDLLISDDVQELMPNQTEITGKFPSAYGLAVVWGARSLMSGTDPVDSVVSSCTQLIRYSYEARIAELSKSGPVSLSDKIKEFEFAYQEWAKVKNKSTERLKNDVTVANIQASPWDEELSYKKDPQKFCRELLRCLPDVGFADFLGNASVFGDSNMSIIGTQGILDGATYLAKNGIDPVALRFAGEDYYKFMKNCIYAVLEGGSRTTRYASNLLMSFDLDNLVKRLTEDGELTDVADIAAWMNYTEAIQYLMPKGVFLDIGFMGPEVWLQSPTFRRLLTSKDVKERLNALVMLNFRGKFQKFIDWKDTHNNADYTDDLKRELEAIRNIDAVHAAICDELESNGSSFTLEFLIRADKGFDTKEEFINTCFGLDDRTLVNGLLESSIKSGSDASSLGTVDSVLTQMKQAKVPLSKFRKSLRDAAIAEVDQLGNYLADSRNEIVTAESLVEGFTFVVQNNAAEVSIEPLVEMIADAPNYISKLTEKGTSINTSAHWYNQNDYGRNGNQTSFLNDNFYSPLGCVTAEDLLANPQMWLAFIANPSLTITVVDEGSGQRTCEFGRDAIFKWANGNNYNPDRGYTAQDIMALLRKCPTFITYLGGLGVSSSDAVGAVRDVPARTGTFYDVIADMYIGPETENKESKAKDNEQRRYERIARTHLNRVKNALYSDIRFPGIVYACLPEQEQIDIAAGKRPNKALIEETIDTIARCWYASKTQYPGFEQDVSQRNLHYVAANKMMNYLEDFAKTIDIAWQRSTAASVENIRSYFNGALEFAMADSILLEDVIDFLDTNGLDIEAVIVRGKEAKLLAAEYEKAAGVADSYSVDSIAKFYIALAHQLGSEVDADFKDQYISRVASLLEKVDYDPDPNGPADGVLARRRAFANSMYDDIYGMDVTDNLIPEYAELFDYSISQEDRLNELERIITEISDDLNNPLLKKDIGEKSDHQMLIDAYKKIPIDSQKQDRRAFLLMLHSYRIKAFTMEYLGWADGVLNPNIAYDYATWQDWFDSLFTNEAYTSLFDENNKVYAEEVYRSAFFNGQSAEEFMKKFPVPSFKDRHCARVYRQLMEITSSGRVVNEVSKNGMNHPKLAGIDAVPIKKWDGDPTILASGDGLSGVSTVADIRNFASLGSEDMPRYVAFPPGHPYANQDPVPASEFISGKYSHIPDDTPVAVFNNPLRNPHGVYLGPATPPSMARRPYTRDTGYKNVIATLNRAQMASIEDLVLKVRKGFGSGGDWSLIRNRNRKSDIHDNRNVDIVSQDEAIKSYEKFIQAATDEVFSNSMYKKDLEKIGIGKYELMQIVQMMTPLVDVVYTIETRDATTGEVIDTKTVHKSIDVKHIFDGTWDSFVQRYEAEITGSLDAGQVLSNTDAQFLVLPLTAIAARIEDHIAPLSIQGMSSDQLAEEAFNAMTNWDDYDGAGKLDIGELMSRLQPLGYTYQAIRAARDTTSVQKLHQELVERSLQKSDRVFSEGRHWTDLRTLPTSTKEGTREYQIVESRNNIAGRLKPAPVMISEFSFGESLSDGVSISRVFTGDKTPSFGLGNERWDADFKTAIKDLASNDNVYFSQGDSVLALCDSSKSQKQFFDAVSYARATKSDLLIPKAFYHGETRGLTSVSLNVEFEKERNGQGGQDQLVEMWRVSYNHLSLTPSALLSGAHARVQLFDPEKEFIDILLDEDGYFSNIGDSSVRMLRSKAEMFNTVGAGQVEVVDLKQFVANDPMFKGNDWVFSTLSQSEIDGIASLDPTADDGFALFEQSFSQLSKQDAGFGLANGEGMRREVVECARRIQRDGYNNDVSLQSLRGSQFATIIKVASVHGSTVRYIPVPIAKSVGNIEYGNVIYDEYSSTIQLSFNAKIDFGGNAGESAYFKLDATDAAADKAMVSVVDSFGNNMAGFDAVQNYDTPAGRMSGRERQMLYLNLHRTMLKNSFHWLLEPGSNGKLVYANWFLERAKKSGNSEEYIYNTIHGRTDVSSLWQEILIGTYSPDSAAPPPYPPLRPSALKRIVRQAIDSNIPLMSLFGAGRFSINKDGEAVFNPMQGVPDIHAAFDGVEYGDIMDFFAYIGSAYKLIQPRNGVTELAKDEGYLFDNLGRKKCLVNNEIKYCKVFVSPFLYMGHASSIDTPGAEASLGVQQNLNRMAMYGLSGDAYKFSITLARAHRLAPQYLDMGHQLALYHQTADDVGIHQNVYEHWFQKKYEDDLDQIAEDDATFRRILVDNKTGEKIDIEDDNDDAKAVKAAVRKLGEKIGWNEIPYWLVSYLVNHKDGTTKGSGENATISTGLFIGLVDEIIKDYQLSGGKTLILFDEARTAKDRFEIPVLHPSIIDLLCNNTNMNRADYEAAMWDEATKANEALNKLTKPQDRARQTAIRKYLAAMTKTHNDPEAHNWAGDYGYLFGSITVDELADSDSAWGMFLEQRGFDRSAWDEISKDGERKLADLSNKLDQTSVRQKLSIDLGLGGTGWAGKFLTSDVLTRSSKNVVSFSRLAAMLHPGVWVGNITGKVAAQTMMDVLLDLGNNTGLGPFGANYGLDGRTLSEDTIKIINGDAALNASWNALRKTQLIGGDLAKIAAANSPQELIDLLQKEEDRILGGTMSRKMTTAFDFMGGGKVATRQQTRIFFKRLVQFMAAEPALSVYFEKLPGRDDRTLIEDMINADPAKFLLGCFSGKHPELFVSAQKAMNSALIGDMAQRHFLATFLENFCQRHTLANFIFSTTICKFPKYQFNLVGKYAQWFCPVSTLYTIMTTAAQKIDEAYAASHEDEGYVKYNFELDQRFVSIREAMAYDAMHMGLPALAAVLLVLGNGVQPPEDEKKWNDPDEWLICGARVGEAWWLVDILGAFLPTVLYYKSVQLGKPSPDLIIGGALTALWGNPFMRACDVLNALSDFNDGSLYDSKNMEDLYKNAEGGVPGYWEKVNADYAAGFANWATNLILPSVARDLYRSLDSYERSYKQVYQTTPTGRLSESGMKGYTQQTSYADSVLRKACRNNPMLAVLADVFLGSETSYWRYRMPYVLRPDEYQVKNAESHSVVGKTEKEAQQIMIDLWAYISDHSIEEMQEDGFMLDKETLNAFCTFLWDTSYGIEDEWNQKNNNGDLDYYVLADNYDEGKRIFYQLKAAKDSARRDLSDLYYKVKNSYLSKGYQMYARYNTSYKTDSEGNLYATGFRPQGVLPFRVAPGRLSNPEGTAGYENDFNSISAVTGEPLSERALVPMRNEAYSELPAFEAFAANKDGSGYSGKWSIYSGDSTNPVTGAIIPGGSNEKTSKLPGVKYPETKGMGSGSGYPYRTYGGSGGGGSSSRRSSGGGGSSYVPGIGSRANIPNTPNAAVTRSSRTYDTNFDYLRPGVDTKGSRDAYKRGDM